MAIAPLILDYLLRIQPSFAGSRSRSLLEFGEAQTLLLSLETRLSEISARTGLSVEAMSHELAQCRAQPADDVAFDEARLVYRWLLGMERYRAVDAGARNPDWRINLNYPFELGERFDILVNNGTSEHVFNQANFFEMMHVHSRPGSLMVHYTPGLGWIDHGHFNVQPSFFFDLARANNYEVLSCALVSDGKLLPLVPGQFTPEGLAAEPLLRDSLLCACLRRMEAGRFRFPEQQVYHHDVATVSKG